MRVIQISTGREGRVIDVYFHTQYGDCFRVILDTGEITWGPTKEFKAIKL